MAKNRVVVKDKGFKKLMKNLRAPATSVSVGLHAPEGKDAKRKKKTKKKKAKATAAKANTSASTET